MDFRLNRPNHHLERETGSKLVSGLMERQDEILIQLDQLNANIEAMIKELTTRRFQEAAKQDAAASNDESLQSTVQKRAAA